MRLTDLFEQVILEAPEEEVTNNRRTVTFAASDVYMMSMLPIPKRLDEKTGKMVADTNDFEQRTYIVGTEPGMVDPKFAAGISQWKKDGSIPGSIRDMETGELVPYDSNSYLADVGRTLIGATLELGANLTRFGATGLDYVTRGNQQATDLVLTKFGFPDVIDSDGPMQFPYTKAATGTKENPMWLDSWSNAVNDTRDLKFQDEEDMTANAVQGFGDLAGLFIGNSGATWGGAFALLAGELPSEIVDVALLAGTSWWTGGALNVAFNASEAGGAAAIEIQRKIEAAYEEGTLQKTAHWDMNMQAAKDMIEAEGTVYESDQEYNDAVEKLAMDQTIYASYQNGLLKVAMTAGVLDSVADRLMIRPPVPSKFVKNAVLKKMIAGKDKTKAFAKGAVTEAGQEGLEQILINLAVIHGTGDKQVSSTYEGVINAMYNSVYGTAASGVVQGGVTTANLGSKGTKATYAQLRRFFAGEGTVEDLFRFAKDGDIEALKAAVRNNDPNSEKFGQLDFVGALKRRDKNFVTVDDLSKKDKQKFLDGTLTSKDKRDGLKIKGKRYDIALLESNTKDAELMSMFQNSIDMRAEGKIQSTLENEEQVKYVAQRLGIYVKGDDINTMMAKLEDITKMDIRIAGSSTLEAPLWSELTPQQKRQFVTDGEIRFSNDPERGNQIWSRDKVLYTSRINGETLPSEIQNLANNVEARPTVQSLEAKFGSADEQGGENEIRKFESDSYLEMRDDQEFWDQEFGATHNPDGSPKDPNAKGDAGRQLTDDDLGVEGSNGARPDRGQAYYDNLSKQALQRNALYLNAVERNKKFKEERATELKKQTEAWDQKNSTTHHTSGVAKVDSKFIDGAPVGPGVSVVPSDGSAGPGPDVSTVGPDGPGGDTSSADSEFTPGGADADGEVDTTAPGGLGEPSTEEPPAGQTPPEKGPEVQVTSPDGPDGDTSGGDSEFAPDGTDTDADNIDLDTTITSKDLEGPDVDVVPPSLSNDKKIAEAQIVYRMQMNVAEGGYTDAQDLRRTLSILEQDYPGITDKVLTTNVTSYFKNKKQIDKDTAEKLETTEKPAYTPSSRPAEGTEVELDGITYRWLGKEAGKGGMWAVVKPDGTRGTTNHQNHSKLNDKANSTKSTLSKEDVSEIGFGEVDTTPANTQDSIKTAQDQVTPDLSPGPQANAKAQGDGAGQDNNPNAGDGGGTVTNNRPDALDLPGTSAPDSVTGSGRGDGQAELDARRQKAKDDKAKADAEADADNIDLDTTAPKPTTGSGRGDGQAELDARRQKAKDDKAKADAEADAEADADNIDLDTTANTTQQGGRGTPPTAAQSAERAKIARQAQQKADKIKADAEREKAKADADALADVEARADQAAKDAEAKRDAKKAKADADADAENMELDAVPPKIDKIINDPENDQNLLPNVQKVADPNANKPITFIPQQKLTKDQRDAIAGTGKYAQDTETDPLDTGTKDRGKKDKDLDPNTSGIQTANPATDAETDAETDADNIDLDTTTDQQTQTDPNFVPNVGVVTPTKTTAKVTTGKDATTRKSDNLTKTKNINTKINTQSGVRKSTAALAFLGKNNDDEDPDSDLMKFYPAKYRDPLKLDKAKGAMGRASGLSGRK